MCEVANVEEAKILPLKLIPGQETAIIYQSCDHDQPVINVNAVEASFSTLSKESDDDQTDKHVDAVNKK